MIQIDAIALAKYIKNSLRDQEQNEQLLEYIKRKNITSLDLLAFYLSEYLTENQSGTMNDFLDSYNLEKNNEYIQYLLESVQQKLGSRELIEQNFNQEKIALENNQQVLTQDGITLNTIPREIYTFSEPSVQSLNQVILSELRDRNVSIEQNMIGYIKNYIPGATKTFYITEQNANKSPQSRIVFDISPDGIPALKSRGNEEALKKSAKIMLAIAKQNGNKDINVETKSQKILEESFNVLRDNGLNPRIHNENLKTLQIMYFTLKNSDKVKNPIEISNKSMARIKEKAAAGDKSFIEFLNQYESDHKNIQNEATIESSAPTESNSPTRNTVVPEHPKAQTSILGEAGPDSPTDSLSDVLSASTTSTEGLSKQLEDKPQEDSSNRPSS